MQIQINKILLDSAMTKWNKENNHEQTKKLNMKRLPSDYDNCVGELKPVKLHDLNKAYDESCKNTIPPISLKKYKNTNYFIVIDGRHRIVTAIKHNETTISANII